ncbi:predicted protein [Aspergillus terreus NIH2624]|uniref:Cyclin-dependent protein kinase complex component n=1 Tax=Aspergillus terreus (strain NIH 2624 / FGSC A1156) TaxID=341663 RepID=Q0CHG5_ASPTN|nr:uncharacterized protein ATEG_06877 [Aspergillus terreus NIH2624]EAU32261.1 predicted protein [Aspergillus terreus NIH2624]
MTSSERIEHVGSPSRESTQTPGGSAAGENGQNPAIKIGEMPPATALDLLCAHVETLVTSNEEVPEDASSPPVRSRSDSVSSGEVTPSLRVTELHFGPESTEDPGHDRLQQGFLSKRFLSKREPPITLKNYLLRLHKYCPMSTAVYLATSLYLTRMVTIDRVIRPNPRNVHRLLLAGLRVAMKAVEDLSYPHSRVAKVGGVTERELSRLEISFCFLVDFELRVDARMLSEQTRYLGIVLGDGDGNAVA